MAETSLVTPLGDVHLHRRHTPPDSPLRAWSAADELLLDHLGSVDPGRLLVVNDAWGALTVALDRWKPIVWTDSALARAAIDANLERNGLPLLGDRALTGDLRPSGRFDTVLLIVPKSNDLFEWQCRAVGACVQAGSVVLAGAMTRHLARSVVDVLERRLGPVTSHPARRKARVLEVDVDPGRVDEHAAEAGITRRAFTTGEGIEVHEAPGVFSAGHLDVGTALLLDELERHFPASVSGRVADLGSGNGVVAATLGRRWPDASFDSFDVSDLATVAGRATWRANYGDDGRGRALVRDGFAPGSGPYDLIVTNPPFHQGHAEDRHLTERLLGDAAAHLESGGSLVVVAQRHRELHRRLRRWFSRVETVSGHRSHVVLIATGPQRSGS